MMSETVIQSLGRTEERKDVSGSTVIYSCSSFDQWHLQNEKYKGYILERKWPTDGREKFQPLVELLCWENQKLQTSLGRPTFERGVDIEKHVHLPSKTTDRELETMLRSTAQELTNALSSLPIPGVFRNLANELFAMLEDDTVAIGKSLSKLGYPELIVKIETFGENRCARWHRDYYIGRAICTYNGVATEFQEDNNVNFANFESSSNAMNDKCPIDPKRTGQIRAGDILFMRGSRDSCGGLIHRSPIPERWPNGDAVRRFCLKIDVPKGGSCAGSA